ncbi:hypothetical protein VTJ04DRAFT_3254 [Mycothermus thermophilus]|uniref:uncharacterized protein n=1 Tax=Humicola insolens TaxID=85995 RepID=UPI0037447769
MLHGSWIPSQPIRVQVPEAGSGKARETRPCRRTYHGPGLVLSVALLALQRAMEGSLADCSEIRELLKRRAGTAEGKNGPRRASAEAGEVGSAAPHWPDTAEWIRRLRCRRRLK